MKEAKYYKKLPGKKVQCLVCPHNCVRMPGQRGICKVRENIDGKYFSLVYATPCAAEADPIEKKPQYHFLPGSLSYSIGTAGCNLSCKFCQNYAMSQAQPEDIFSFELPPEEIVKKALLNKCKTVAYTYNDPTVFVEYAIDTARIARKKGLKNIFVTNGFINQEPLLDVCKLMDGFHVDLKGFTEEYYKNICGARLKPVLETLETLNAKKKWFEIINLLIPTLNDNLATIRKMCEWIHSTLGEMTVLHFSRFYPMHQLSHLPPTQEKTLLEAKKIAEKVGLKYVYIGNVSGMEDNTMCHNCGQLLIKRTSFFEVLENNIKNGKCFNCKTKIPGVWG